MDHYFTNSSEVASQSRQFVVRVRGVELQLESEAGVFSKRGLDFGTRLLIEAVTLPESGLAVDLGCGYGPVASALGRVYPHSRWLMLDVNARAVEVARRNVRQLGERATALVSDGFSEAGSVRADAILLNPPIRAGKSVIYRLFEESLAHLNPDGALWIVIQKKQGAPSARTELERLFPVVTDVTRAGGYHVFRAARK